MKKLLTLALAAIMIFGCVFSFASCSSQELYFGDEYKDVQSQKDLLTQLKAKSIDVGVMDSIMAGYYMSLETDTTNSLMIVEGLTLATEQYGIAARKGSGLTKMINKTLVELAIEGKVDEIADKYGLKSEVCIDKTLTFGDLSAAEKADWDYITNKGEVVIGYTDFAPISWKNEQNELVGFDVELAKAVCAKLGLTAKFELIEWSAKEAKLDSKAIDCIWNGMTITEERQNAMEVSIPYLNNKQVAVIRVEDKEKYKSTADMADAIIGAESGSAGESCVVKSEEE
ncbi:MAG: transporter substrate-binding domain-containing protein [Clostridia bacterium]|nr:transporter substrate-binding domain-containing protein [Clostridia bacterium]